MVAYDVSVRWFSSAAEFDPPPPLGTTDRSRVKVKTQEEAQGPEMLEWIEQAGARQGWK